LIQKVSTLSLCLELGLFGTTGIVAFFMVLPLTLVVLSPLLEKSASCGI
jgi:hypothetical protein